MNNVVEGRAYGEGEGPIRHGDCIEIMATMEADAIAEATGGSPLSTAAALEERTAKLLAGRLVPIVSRHFTGWALRSRNRREWDAIAREVLVAVTDARAAAIRNRGVR